MTDSVSSNKVRRQSLARSSSAFLVGLEASPLFLSDEDAGRFRFPRVVRDELASKFSDDTIQSLEWAAATYLNKKKMASKNRVELGAALRSEQRIAAKLDGLIRELESAPDLLKTMLSGLETMATGMRTLLKPATGRPADQFRRDLEIAIARTLKERGYPLRRSRTGRLAFALKTVVRAVEPRLGMYDPMRVIIRVCRQMGEEGRQLDPIGD